MDGRVGTRVARGGCGRMVLLVAVGMAQFVYLFLVYREIARPSGSLITLIGWRVGRFDLCCNVSLFCGRPSLSNIPGQELEETLMPCTTSVGYDPTKSTGIPKMTTTFGGNGCRPLLDFRPHPLASEWLRAKQAGRETDGSKRRIIWSTFPVDGNLVVANGDDKRSTRKKDPSPVPDLLFLSLSLLVPPSGCLEKVHLVVEEDFAVRHVSLQGHNHKHSRVLILFHFPHPHPLEKNGSSFPLKIVLDRLILDDWSDGSRQRPPPWPFLCVWGTNPQRALSYL